MQSTKIGHLIVKSDRVNIQFIRASITINSLTFDSNNLDLAKLICKNLSLQRIKSLECTKSTLVYFLSKLEFDSISILDSNNLDDIVVPLFGNYIDSINSFKQWELLTNHLLAFEKRYRLLLSMNNLFSSGVRKKYHLDYSLISAFDIIKVVLNKSDYKSIINCESLMRCMIAYDKSYEQSMLDSFYNRVNDEFLTKINMLESLYSEQDRGKIIVTVGISMVAIDIPNIFELTLDIESKTPIILASLDEIDELINTVVNFNSLRFALRDMQIRNVDYEDGDCVVNIKTSVFNKGYPSYQYLRSILEQYDNIRIRLV
jgi:hypothetical protein